MLSRLYQGSFPLSPYLIHSKKCYVNMCDQELLGISIQEVKGNEHELSRIFCTKEERAFKWPYRDQSGSLLLPLDVSRFRLRPS
jgi:hypothetical protein